jgi:glycosyltransferase involved in cell wall biosynthesis
MKVLHISNDAQIGGAGIAAYRLHKGLRSLGVESLMLVNKQMQRDIYIVPPTSSYDKIISKLAPRLERIPKLFSNTTMDLVSSAWFPDRLLGRIDKLTPDILNLHWVNHGFMRIETLPRLRQPVVWTLHDMWPFAGGEHYVGDSTRYIEGYNSNNRPIGESGIDINRWVWKRKKKSWSSLKSLVIATPSKWLAECAGNSQLFHNHRIVVLPNGVDHERFHPMDHSIARSILGLPDDKRLVLFGAGSATSDKRKGFHLLVEALKKMEAEINPADYELVVFGASSGDDSFSMKAHYLGCLRDEISMAVVYAAADVFVAPSHEDNLPNTVLESLSCGTPVVAFKIGGMPDMVSHKKSGYLASAFDTTELVKGLLWVMEDEHRWKNLSRQARGTVEQFFSLHHTASRYLELYEEILEK